MNSIESGTINYWQKKTSKPMWVTSLAEWERKNRGTVNGREDCGARHIVKIMSRCKDSVFTGHGIRSFACGTEEKGRKRIVFVWVIRMKCTAARHRKFTARELRDSYAPQMLWGACKISCWRSKPVFEKHACGPVFVENTYSDWIVLGSKNAKKRCAFLEPDCFQRWISVFTKWTRWSGYVLEWQPQLGPLPLH